jgi:ribosomal protein S18 acetylase RimI-like enzyme
MTIRNAEPPDIELIRQMAYDIWPQTYGDILSKDQLPYMLDLIYSPSSLEKQMREGHIFFIVADHEQPVGFASYSLAAPDQYKLHKIYVHPSQQGKGTGRFIIDYLVNQISKLGANSLRLNVNRHNKARNFYERLGFVVIGEEDVDIGNGYFMNDYVMEMKLGGG